MPLFAPRNFVLLILAGAPIAVSAQATKAAATPSGAVEEFMRALADSNLTRMAELWGTAKGPVFRTKPKNYEKQIVIMQLFLHGATAQTLGEVPGEKSGTRTVTTLLSHSGCTVTLPFTVAKANEGWVVENFDLDRAGQVNHPCETSRRPGNSEQ